ncbi:membrane protein [Dietzia sp. UCD-THP]|uniref:KPN_02809 family neutral zinc metallopeptidase n=1 Tax=Dietzia sp. UCD-THP TaxID=1292020 RepID=UPI000364AA97|nr:neutral zinc metallopeptidase [Dietzia sp. UCD-THP]EYT63646.1 membrane protein [Dietzia sp. UCD-THP]
MTFRQSGSLDTSGVSGGGRGGRGGRRGIAVGGGVGGLAVVLVALFLGVDPSLLGLEQGDGGRGPTSDSAQRFQSHIDQCDLRQANTDTVCRIVATTESLEDVWSSELPAQAGMRWVQPHTTVFTGDVDTACGAASSAVGPFYCPADQDVYIDPAFFDEVLVGRLGAPPSGAAQMYVVAHEFGHHLQTMLGDIRRSQQDPRGPSSAAVRVELQADCYAGLWAHYATSTPGPGGGDPLLESLTDEDVDEIVRTAEVIGDDHIQSSGGARVDPGSWTHGSSQMRRQWFLTGYDQGSIRACDTFGARV